ncbi:TaqI-like C-terminal specificity domain-containing protein [Proteinivorax hydrogeniformans]|uniref:TaqI-like C-terminal specificity domain-containing protein n=1 Tax=Proteinivorax hydrogeniformans TaxID=1826727 RepID=A0AAU8HRR5_9FIRM
MKRYVDNFKHLSLNQVFDDATVDACIIILEKQQYRKMQPTQVLYNNSIHLDQNLFGSSSWVFNDNQILEIKNKVENAGIKIKQLKGLKITWGIKTGLNDAFIINERQKNLLLEKNIRNREIIKPVLRGKDIGRYMLDYKNKYLINTKYDLDIKNKYPDIYEYLLPYKERLMSRSDQGKEWYNLRSSNIYEELEAPKILFAEIINTTPNRPKFYYDEQEYYIEATGFMINNYDNYKLLLAILNSTISMFYIKLIGSTLNTNGIRYKKIFLKEFPIIKNGNDTIIKEINGYIEKIKSINTFDKFNISLENLIKYHEKIDNVNIYAERIDKLVCQLYKINKEEYIKMLESLELGYKKEFDSSNMLITLDHEVRMSYVEKLSIQLSREKFKEEHVSKGKSIEKIANQYGFEYETVALLRRMYTEQLEPDEKVKYYEPSKLFESINCKVNDTVFYLMVKNSEYISLGDIKHILENKLNNFEDIITTCRTIDDKIRGVEIASKALNSEAYTWNAYRKAKQKGKVNKTFIKYYDNQYYGLAEWSDEIHKKYFLDAFKKYTESNPNEKKAKDLLKLFKDLDIEDKQDYIELMEEKIERTFN